MSVVHVSTNEALWNAIDVASPGTTIVVAPGSYVWPGIALCGRGITLQGSDGVVHYDPSMENR